MRGDFYFHYVCRHKLLFEIKNSSHDDPPNFEEQRESLQVRISKWRRLQESVMPQVGEYVQRQNLSLQGGNRVEHEILYLPSDLPLATQVTLGLTSLAQCQRRLLEGAACDTIQ